MKNLKNNIYLEKNLEFYLKKNHLVWTKGGNYQIIRPTRKEMFSN